ncbi:MAG: sodium:proton antiporter, partial [Anaerotignum sp.]|nr:sodium:proton antiporter [Anaerotignum sp.]
MEHHLNLVHNIPFFSIFFAMFCGIITPLIKNGRTARRLHGAMVAIVGVLSVILLINVVQDREAFTFMMGHFPAPWGNELRVGPLEALLAVLISVVMFLTVTAGSDQLFREIVPEKQNFYFIMLNATFGAMLAMTYTNDLFTAYVFIEILTIASCTL